MFELGKEPSLGQAACAKPGVNRRNGPTSTWSPNRRSVRWWSSGELGTSVRRFFVAFSRADRCAAAGGFRVWPPERPVISGSLHHGGHPILRRPVSNVTVETYAAANIKPGKKKSTERIDGIAVTAPGRVMLCVEPRSVYEARGIVWS